MFDCPLFFYQTLEALLKNDLLFVSGLLHPKLRCSLKKDVFKLSSNPSFWEFLLLVAPQLFSCFSFKKFRSSNLRREGTLTGTFSNLDFLDTVKLWLPAMLGFHRGTGFLMQKAKLFHQPTVVKPARCGVGVFPPILGIWVPACLRKKHENRKTASRWPVFFLVSQDNLLWKLATSMATSTQLQPPTQRTSGCEGCHRC